jgi:AP-1 complex subunit beta-1
MQSQPPAGSSGLEGLTGTPQRVASPTAGVLQPSNTMDDLMGIFGNDGSGAAALPPGASADLMNGFGGLDLGGSSAQPPAASQKKNNEDILGLF